MKDVREWYVEQFQQYESRLNGERENPFHKTRKQALRRFLEIGFPHRKDEEWRFTNIQPIVQQTFLPLTAPLASIALADVERYMINGAHRIVLVDGFYSAELSDVSLLPKEVIAESFASALKNAQPALLSHYGKYVPADANAFTALNAAFFQDGVFFYVPPSTVVEAPIQILMITTSYPEPTVRFPRNLFVFGDSSRVTLVEMHLPLTDQTYFNNKTSEIVVGKNAFVEYTQVTLEGSSGYHVASTSVVQQEGSRLVSNAVVLQGAIVRNNFSVHLGASNCDCRLNGLSVAVGSSLVDHHTAIEHAFPHCTSFQVYKTILGGKARGVFNGKIFVRKHAQKTDAKQTNKTLLLSDDAVMNAKPQLEIFADDVKCTHGAAIGQLDTEQIFYLRTRGIDEQSARNMLTFAFASDALAGISIPQLQEMLEPLLHERLDISTK